MSEPTAPTIEIAPMTETLHGHIDGISPDGWLDGWAVNLPAPHRPAEIRVLDAGKLVAIGSADNKRLDVKLAGFGNGFCGFSLVLPDEVFDGREHTLSVFARTNADQPEPLGTVVALLLPRQPAPVNERGATAVRPRPAGTLPASLQQIRAEFLEGALNTALARVEELERSHRLIAAERDTLATQLRLLGEQFTNDLNVLSGTQVSGATAAYLGHIVRSVSLTRRREIWLDELTAHGLSGPILALQPHDGVPGRLSVLVWGSGGIGDLLYLSTVVRELFLQLGDCQIFVLNEHPAVTEVFANNPFVVGTMFLEGAKLYSFVQMAQTLDIFDLVAEIRYCVTYTAPPLSRAPGPLLHAASVRSAEWQRYVRYQWPHLNNIFANEVMARGLTQLALVGITSLLPIDGHTEIDFFLPDWYPELLPSLIGERFATIHHGSDKEMAATGGVQTKNLPTGTWIDIIQQLAAAGLKVVQLGAEHEPLVPGVDIDLRGKTSLTQTAYVLKMASVHVDTEGGLVHLARAMHTRSVVAFGPTPVGFFGYPQNENIAPPLCGNCWWTADRWAAQCPREMDQPECMASQSAEVIAARAVALAQTQHAFSLHATEAVADADLLAFARARLDEGAQPGARGVVVLGPGADPQLIDAFGIVQGEVAYLVPTEMFAQMHALFGDAYLIVPYSGGGVSRNTASLDWAVALGCDPLGRELAMLSLELGRCVRPGGRVLLGLAVAKTMSLADLLWNFDLIRTRQVGSRYRIDWPPDLLDRPDTSTLAAGTHLFVELADCARDAAAPVADPMARRGQPRRTKPTRRQPEVSAAPDPGTAGTD